MPNIQLTHDEINLVVDAINLSVTSAKRAQKSGKTPQITEVYRLHEVTLTDIGNKFIKAAVTKS